MTDTDWDFEAEVVRRDVDQNDAPAAMAPAQPMPIQFYPIPLAQVPQQSEQAPSLLSRRFLGLPVWLWGIGAVGAAGGAYYYYNQKLASNDGEDGEKDVEPAIGDSESWGPSRSRMAKNIEDWCAKRGVSGVTVYSDADEATKRKIKPVSPLITLKTTTPIPVAELDKVCRRDGLQCTEHDGGVIGLYPTSSRRGKAWEKYVDDLRDEGQTV
jgi:hypothetical protein